MSKLTDKVLDKVWPTRPGTKPGAKYWNKASIEAFKKANPDKQVLIRPGSRIKEEVEQLDESSALSVRKSLTDHLGKIGFKTTDRESSGGQHKAWLSHTSAVDHEAVTKHLQKFDKSTKHFAPEYEGDRHTWHGKGWSVEHHGEKGLFASSYRKGEAGERAKQGLDEAKDVPDSIEATYKFGLHSRAYQRHKIDQGWSGGISGTDVYDRNWKREMAHHKKMMNHYAKYMKEETIEEAVKPKVGDKVIPKIGPHANTPHEVIHVHDDGSFNIRPLVRHGAKIHYKLGAARATGDQVNKMHEGKEHEDAILAMTRRKRRAEKEAREKSATTLRNAVESVENVAEQSTLELVKKASREISRSTKAAIEKTKRK